MVEAWAAAGYIILVMIFSRNLIEILAREIRLGALGIMALLIHLFQIIKDNLFKFGNRLLLLKISTIIPFISENQCIINDFRENQ